MTILVQTKKESFRSSDYVGQFSALGGRLQTIFNKNTEMGNFKSIRYCTKVSEFQPTIQQFIFWQVMYIVE